MGLLYNKYVIKYYARKDLFSKMENGEIYVKAKDKYAAEKIARKELGKKYRILGIGTVIEEKD